MEGDDDCFNSRYTMSEPVRKPSRVPPGGYKRVVKVGRSYKELLKEALKKEPVNYDDYKNLIK